MESQSSLKDLIVSKLDSKIQKISNDRVLLKNYNEIKSKTLGNLYIFFHHNYSKVNLNFFKKI